VKRARISFRHRLARALPLVLFAMVLSFLLDREGAFRQFESFGLDLAANLRRARRPSAVAVVSIADSDYQALFGGRSPLDPEALVRLIDAVAQGQPKVIGVDLDTAAPGFKELVTRKGWPPVVWGRSAVFSKRRNQFRVDEVLGGTPLPPDSSGLMTLKLDEDRAVRRYQRMYETDRGFLPSLPWAVVEASWRGQAPSHRESTTELLIDFGDPGEKERLHLAASRVLEVAGAPGWKRSSPVRGKIVLIGGDYGGRDEHDTPLGWMSGVEVIAQIVDTELLGGGQGVASDWVIFALQSVGGVVLLLLFHLFRAGKALLVSVGAVLALTPAFSLVAFGSVSRWAYFVPFLIAVLIADVQSELTQKREEILKEAVIDLASKEKDRPEPAEGEARMRPRGHH
jgi:CHASE2 domain-containing sensor protein